MHKNPKVPKSAKLAPRDSHCQYLIKLGSIVWVSVSSCVCTCRGGIGTFIWYIFIVKSYWYYWRLPWQGDEQHGLEREGYAQPALGRFLVSLSIQVSQNAWLPLGTRAQMLLKCQNHRGCVPSMQAGLCKLWQARFEICLPQGVSNKSARQHWEIEIALPAGATHYAFRMWHVWMEAQGDVWGATRATPYPSTPLPKSLLQDGELDIWTKTLSDTIWGVGHADLDSRSFRELRQPENTVNKWELQQ